MLPRRLRYIASTPRTTGNTSQRSTGCRPKAPDWNAHACRSEQHDGPVNRACVWKASCYALAAILSWAARSTCFFFRVLLGFQGRITRGCRLSSLQEAPAIYERVLASSGGRRDAAFVGPAIITEPWLSQPNRRNLHQSLLPPLQGDPTDPQRSDSRRRAGDRLHNLPFTDRHAL
jgi:hypothetical protein